MDQMQADEQLRLPVGHRANGMLVPDLVEQIAFVGHEPGLPIEKVARSGAESQGSVAV